MTVSTTEDNKMTNLYISEITLRPRSGAGTGGRRSYVTPEARVYVHPKGENILENLEQRHARPYNVYKEQVLPALWRMLGLSTAGTLGRVPTVRWSQKAGCSCPCSPGFVVTDGNVPFDIYVTVTNLYTGVVKINGTIKA